MDALILLVPISLVLVAVAVWLFLKMSDSGQFDDMDGPAHSILMDDDRPRGCAEPRGEAGDNAVDKAGDDIGREPPGNTR